MDFNSFPTNVDKKERSESSFPMNYLIGNRFFIDQPSIEMLSELLMVLTAQKKINGESEVVTMFPLDEIGSELKEMTYTIKHRMYFKLFSLWSSGKNPKNSELHATEFENIKNNMVKTFAKKDHAERHLEILANLYQGFQIAGASRDWCARSFLPISKNLLTGETIWRTGKKQQKTIQGANDFNDIKECFDHGSRDFYARGGEVLYLQLLLAFTKTKADVEDWLKNEPQYVALRIDEQEKNPKYLMKKVEKGFERMYNSQTIPKGFEKFIDFIEEVNKDESYDKEDRFNFTVSQKIGFINEDTWYLGYLFALELSRLFDSQFDSIDLIRLLQLECSLHCMRSIVFQSVRYLGKTHPLLAVVSPDCEEINKKTIGARSWENCLKLVKQAYNQVNKDKKAEISDEISSNNDKKKADVHADYGYPLVRKLAKELGVVVPKTGGNEHFVLSKNLLILFVSTTLKPNESLTVESFLDDIEIRWGLVFDEKGFTRVNEENSLKQKVSDPHMLDWFINMLTECGYFVPLSDHLSLVKNNNIAEEEK